MARAYMECFGLHPTDEGGYDDGCRLADAVLAALPEYEQVREAIKQAITVVIDHADHGDDCAMWCGDYPCTCGLIDAITTLHVHAGEPVYIVREPSTPKVCPTCGTKEAAPPLIYPRPPGREMELRGRRCPDPFHSQGEPEGATP